MVMSMFEAFLFCVVMLIWGRTNKNVLVDNCGNVMIAKKSHYKVMGNFNFDFEFLKIIMKLPIYV
jgi:hypothetical protein